MLSRSFPELNYTRDGVYAQTLSRISSRNSTKDWSLAFRLCRQLAAFINALLAYARTHACVHISRSIDSGLLVKNALLFGCEIKVRDARVDF